LAIVGNSGMGALEYSLQEKFKYEDSINFDLDYLSHQCSLILDDKECENLDYLIQQGGSSGGARIDIPI
jgi:hypothetical protein